MGGGVRSPGTLRDSWKEFLETGHLSLWALFEGDLGRGSFAGDPEGYVKEDSGDGHLSLRTPVGNLEGGSFTVDFERWMRRMSPYGPIGGPGEGDPSTGTFENSLKEGPGCEVSLSLWELC